MKLNGIEIKVGDIVRHVNGKEGRVEEIVDKDSFPIRVRFPGAFGEATQFRSDSTLISVLESKEQPLKMDDIPVRVDDEVYSLIHGWVKVKSSLVTYFVIEEKSGATHSIQDGGKLARNGMRVVYWDEPKFTPPPRPYKDVDVYQYMYRKRGVKQAYQLTINHYHDVEVAKTAIAERVREEYDFIKCEQTKSITKLTPDVERRGITL